MKQIIGAALFLVLIATVTFAVERVQIRIGGGGAACKAVFIPAAREFEEQTGTQLAINPTTPGQGLIELNDGHIDVAASAHPFEWMVRSAAQNGVIINPNLFKVRQVGTNRTLVFTHKTNKVQKLSKKQLKDIFTGRITNWKSVGGADLPIIVVWGLATPGQNELFSKQILDDLPVLKNHQEATDYRKISEFVARTPGAIGIDPAAFVTKGTKNPKIPAIITPIIAVTKGPPSPGVEQLFAFIKNKK